MSYTRKEFLRNSAVLMAMAMTGSSFIPQEAKRLLSFSTLGCPDWTFRQIVDFAVLHGFTGLEIRGIRRQMDLTKCPEFNSPQSIRATMALMHEKGLKFINLGASAKMHLPEGEERQKNLAEARAFIDLAKEISCPFVRVFPNEFPKGQDRNKTIDIVAQSLLLLGDYAKERDVTVLMETHGDFSRSEDIEKVMQIAEHPHVALVWDIANMWTITKEPPLEVYRKLKKHIRHTHIKDAKLVNGKIQYVFLGQGDVPIFEAIDILSEGGYPGFYSFEWEKLWHPELAEPELAIADYARAMKEHRG